jgi:hypothetical protein
MEASTENDVAAIVQKAQALLVLKEMLGEAAFVEKKTVLLANIKTMAVLTAVMEIDGFLSKFLRFSPLFCLFFSSFFFLFRRARFGHTSGAAVREAAHRCRSGCDDGAVFRGGE